MKANSSTSVMSFNSSLRVGKFALQTGIASCCPRVIRRDKRERLAKGAMLTGRMWTQQGWHTRGAPNPDVPRGLVRLHVGLEDVHDLQRDLERALVGRVG